MSRSMRHKDMEFHVEAPGHTGIGLQSNVFRTFDEAASAAVALATMSGKKVNLDVVIWSKAGAKFYGGDDAVAQYEEDPDASVFDRIEIKANVVGRVP